MYKSNVDGSTDLEKSIWNFMNDEDLLSTEVSYNCQTYKVSDLVVLEAQSTHLMKIGLIRSILIRDNKVLFVVNVYSASRCLLRFFKAELLDSEVVFIQADSLADYKPLINYGSATQIYFCLHHHISCDFE